jgi:hypothetical protein
VNQSQPHSMSLQTLQEVLRQVLTQGKSQVSFGWQGVKATLVGHPFSEHAVAFQQKYGRNQSVSNGLKTNGLTPVKPPVFFWQRSLFNSNSLWQNVFTMTPVTL